MEVRENDPHPVALNYLCEWLKALRHEVTCLELAINPNAVCSADELRIFKGVLHRLQLYREVTLDGPKVAELLDLIGSWSYAHRVGNGENSEGEQDALIAAALRRLALHLNPKEHLT